MADERTLANGTLLPDMIRTAPDAQLGVRMLAILPSAFTEAHYDAGYLSAIDPAAEFSLARGLDRPMSGQVFFEWVIGATSTLAPDRGSLIVRRRDYVLRRRAGRARIGPACPTEWSSARGCSTPDDESVDNQEDE